MRFGLGGWTEIPLYFGTKWRCFYRYYSSPPALPDHPKNLGPPNFCVKKLKMKAFQLLLPPLKFALRLLQFGMCIVNDICDTPPVRINLSVCLSPPLTRHFFHFPPGWSANKRVGKVTRLSYPIESSRRFYYGPPAHVHGHLQDH